MVHEAGKRAEESAHVEVLLTRGTRVKEIYNGLLQELHPSPAFAAPLRSSVTGSIMDSGTPTCTLSTEHKIDTYDNISASHDTHTTT